MSSGKACSYLLKWVLFVLEVLVLFRHLSDITEDNSKRDMDKQSQVEHFTILNKW